jgi:hypothetical protein
VSDDEIHNRIDERDISLAFEMQEHTHLLAHLLINEVVFLNSHNPWPNGLSGTWSPEGIGVNVICNDTFAYACADCERLDYDQIPVLYKQWQREPIWGATAWCIARRKERPITPVVKLMTERGYDVDALIRGELP